MPKLSRAQIAKYAVDSLESGAKKNDVIREIAAFLVAEKREDEQDLLIRDILSEFEARGTVVANVTSAKKLDAEIRAELKEFIDGDKIELVETIDPEVIGGFEISTPTKFMDATVRRRLTNLRNIKNLQGE